MKELHCMLCDAFWYVDEEDEKEDKYCPFCAAELWKQDGIIIDSFDKALLRVIRFAGIEVLKNKKMLISYLFDMAPEYGKEIRIFSKSCNDTLLRMFYEASQIKNSDVNASVSRQRKTGMARQILRDKEGLSDAWIDIIINALIYALEWEKEPMIESSQTQSKPYFLFHRVYINYNNRICQGCSNTYSDDIMPQQEQICVATLADGKNVVYLRGAYGARKVVEIAKDCLIEFGKAVAEERFSEENIPKRYHKSLTDVLADITLSNKNNKENWILKSLTNTIVSRWHYCVQEDIHKNPLLEYELEKIIRYQNGFANILEENRLSCIYGTTLLAVLIIRDYMVVIQQGDGRCDVLYEDGTKELVIPWEKRYFGNIAASISDDNVAESIQMRVLDLKKKKIIACFLCSDSLEKCFNDTEKLYDFYREMTDAFQSGGIVPFEEYLDSGCGRKLEKIRKEQDILISGIIRK